MRLVFAGTPLAAVPSLRSLAADHDIVGVITRQDAPVGRKRVMRPSPVAEVADELGLPVRKANRLGEGETEWVRSLAPDLGVVVAYGGLIDADLLAVPRLGWINLHFSDLPRWRGAAPVQRALMAGEQELGITVFALVEALDAGHVLTRDAMTFPPGTPGGDALQQLADHGTVALGRAVDGLRDGTIVPEPQIGESSYARKLSRSDGALDLSRPADRVLAHWAGATPEPGAYALSGGQAVKILEMRAMSDPPPAEPVGTVVLHGTTAILHVEDGTLELVRVQPSGKGPMPAADWIRGRGGRLLLDSAVTEHPQ